MKSLLSSSYGALIKNKNKKKTIYLYIYIYCTLQKKACGFNFFLHNCAADERLSARWLGIHSKQCLCNIPSTRLRAGLVPPSRWTRRSVTFCGTWWLRDPSSGWGAGKCHSAGTWGSSPFSSGCRPSSERLQKCSLLGVTCWPWWPSWCYSQCWPDEEERKKGKKKIKKRQKGHNQIIS